ncbi:MAG: thioredoxin [Bacilli bacterium]|nr:thioredoxin [Bacilli bacterium]
MIKYLKEENFNDEINKGIVLVDFYADWCGPCKMMGQVLEKMEHVNILKVNTDEFEELSQKYGVMSIPTMILFKDGKEIAKKIGFVPQEELENWIEENQK